MKRHWSYFRPAWAGLTACLCVATVSGCAHLTARKCCPTYLGHNHLLTSEAVRVLPCGPDGPFFGMKKTMWREWPMEWQLWQPASCPEMQPLETIPPGVPSVPPGFEQPLGRPAPVYNMPQVPGPAGQEPQPAAPAAPQQPAPDDLFGPQDSLEPNPPTLPGAEQPNDSVAPSSWSQAQSSGTRGMSGDEQHRWDALLLRRLDSPGPDSGDSVPLRAANTRAPRPAKLRR